MMEACEIGFSHGGMTEYLVKVTYYSQVAPISFHPFMGNAFLIGKLEGFI